MAAKSNTVLSTVGNSCCKQRPADQPQGLKIWQTFHRSCLYFCLHPKHRSDQKRDRANSVMKAHKEKSNVSQCRRKKTGQFLSLGQDLAGSCLACQFVEMNLKLPEFWARTRLIDIIYPEVGACGCKSACAAEPRWAIDANHHEAKNPNMKCATCPEVALTCSLFHSFPFMHLHRKPGPEGQRSARSALMS